MLKLFQLHIKVQAKNTQFAIDRTKTKEKVSEKHEKTKTAKKNKTTNLQN